MTGTLSVMDTTGDTKIMWDAGNQDEVDNAKATFDRFKKKGYIAYSVDKKGDKGDILTEFDRNLTKIILTPPLRGG